MIRAFLSFIEARGTGDVGVADLRAALAADGDEGRRALVAAQVVRASGPATTHPCDGADCAREVRERVRAADGSRRFLAVCTRSPRECETVHLDETDVAQERIDLAAFLELLRRLFQIEPPLVGESTARAPAPGGGDEPLLLGEHVQDRVARDVFFTRKPRAAALRGLLAERKNARRGALVLIPTARGIAPTLLGEHAAGHVEIGVLADWLTVHDGKIVATPRLRKVTQQARPDAPTDPVPPAAGPARSTLVDRLPRAKSWREVAFHLVEHPHDAIGVEIDGRSRVVTTTELGMVSTQTGAPVRAFTLLCRICEGNGVFDTRPWGNQENGKKVVSELRQALTAAFEIGESPIEPYSRGAKSWKTRFRAFSEPQERSSGTRGRRR